MAGAVKRNTKPTDPMKAVAIMALGDAGYTATEAGRKVGVPQTTALDIIKGHGRWGEVAERPVFIRLRAEQNKTLEALARKMAADSWAKATEKMGDASYYQLVMGGAILLDKARLLAGEPSHITEVNVNIGSLDTLAALVAQVAEERRREIDVTPAQNLGKAEDQALSGS